LAKALSNKDFGALTAEIKAGTFEELLNATLNKTYFKNNSSAVGWQVIFDIPKIGSRINLKI
jgi:hypothetical protein